MHSDDVLRFGVRSMRLGWSHVSHATIRWYNFLCYTLADVDDAPVCLLMNIFELTNTEREKVAGRCNRGVPRFCFTTPVALCG